MKLREQGAVLNHGNEAQDRLPASLLHVLCPSTVFPSLMIQRWASIPGHFLQEQECEQGATQGTSWAVFSAAGCRLPHTLMSGKKGNSWFKASPAHAELPAVFVSHSGAAGGSPFTGEAGQAPALLLEVSVPLIQLCPAPQWLSAWPEGEVAGQPLMASFWSLAPSPAGLCGMLRTPSCNTSHSGCVRAVTRARGGGLQHAVTHSFVSVSRRQQLPLRIIRKHRVWSLEP